MLDVRKIREILYKLPTADIIDLWEIGQHHDYDSVRVMKEWSVEDEFWRQVGCIMRERG